MPGLFQSADRESLRAQNQYLSRRRFELMLLVGAAVCALADTKLHLFNLTVVPGSILAGILFLAAGLLEASVFTVRPERIWYQGRALAESTKTLVWRYAMMANPFQAGAPDSDSVLRQRLRQVVEEFPSLKSTPIVDVDAEITPWMRATRSSSLAVRREIYKNERIEDQRRWYSFKAVWNRRRARIWGLAAVGLQVIGMAAGFARGFNLETLDLLSVIAVIATVAVAWLQIKQHTTLAQTYEVAAADLSTILRLFPDTNDETAWGVFVDEAENAISREHTTWLARRT